MVNANNVAARTEQILSTGRPAILRACRRLHVSASSIKDTRVIAELLAKIELAAEGVR